MSWVALLSVLASAVIVAGAMLHGVRALWRGIRVLERLVTKVDDHELRLARLEAARTGLQRRKS